MRPRTWALWLILLFLFSTLSRAQNNTCAGTVILNATTELQFLTTPNYESSYKYPPFLDCRFVIKAPDKTRIVLEIIDMEMEPRVFDECSDYVAIKDDVFEKNASKFITLCETLTNRQFLSTSNTLSVVFQTDDFLEFRGAKLSYRYYDTSSCPPGWTEISDQKCLKFEIERKTDWIRAQNHCLEQKSNLISLACTEKTSELQELYNNAQTRFWTAYTDSDAEGRLNYLNQKEAIRIPGRDMPVALIDNNDDNDCMTLQIGGEEPYRIDGCAANNGYICEMNKDGTSVLYPPPIDNIQEGAYARTNQNLLWLLLFLLILLFLTILTFLCFMCCKQKDSRVHTEHVGVQQNAFVSDTTHRTEQSRTSVSGPASAISQPSNSNEMRPPRSTISPVSVAVENNKGPKRFPMAPIPNRLPSAEDSAGTEQMETTILGSEIINEDTVSAAPKPQPRTLPPIPAREGTFHSINTRDGSTMRTRRNKELFERPIMHVLDNVSAISLDEFWSNKKP